MSVENEMTLQLIFSVVLLVEKDGKGIQKREGYEMKVRIKAVRD
jgi:hypothetical protein